MKELENKINAFAQAKGKQAISVLESLLDYIIGYLDPTCTPNKEWKYGKEDNVEFYNMMTTYFQITERKLAVNLWFDAWGDLFMSLITKGGNKGQFFTPPSLCNMMSEITLTKEPKATQRTTFGKRVIINDCACGSSRNLLAAMAVFNKNGWMKPYLVAEDIDLLCCKMSAVNMAIHGCFGEVICHDTLCEPSKVRQGYIINETMYPFQTNIPSIRPCSEENNFFSTSVWKTKQLKLQNMRINEEKAIAILSRIDKRIKTHERFLMKVGYIMSLKYTDEQKQEILKNACWVDGTIAGQVQYAQEQRAKLRKSYSVLRERFVKLKIIKRYGVY